MLRASGVKVILVTRVCANYMYVEQISAALGDTAVTDRPFHLDSLSEL